MCRENEPIKEMLTTAENRNNLATIKAATTKNWHTHGEREMERVAREGDRERWEEDEEDEEPSCGSWPK